MRDPVVVTASLPRFLDIGDRSRLQFDLDNVEGEAGEYKLSLDIHGPVAAAADALSKTIKLARARKGDGHASRSRPTASGPRRCRSTSPAPASRRRRALRSASNPGTPDVYARSVSDLAPGANDQDRRRAAAAASCRAPARCRSAVSPFGAIDAPGGAAGARPLPLWLLGADGEPRDAAALRQPARQRRASRDRSRSRRPHQGGDRQGDDAAGLERRLRPLGRRQPRATIFGSTPSSPISSPARASAISPCRRSVSTTRSTICATPSLNASRPRRRPAAARLCALRAGAQRPAGDRRSALSRRHQARRIQDAAGARADRRGARDARRPRARRPRVRRRAGEPGDGSGEHCFAAGLRLEAARRGGACWRCSAEAKLAPARRRPDALARASAVARRRPRRRPTMSSTQENNWLALAAEALAERQPARRADDRRQAGQGRALSPLDRLFGRRGTRRRSPTTARRRSSW